MFRTGAVALRNWYGLKRGRYAPRGPPRVSREVERLLMKGFLGVASVILRCRVILRSARCRICTTGRIQKGGDAEFAQPLQKGPHASDIHSAFERHAVHRFPDIFNAYRQP
jgi:hypothetical protein